MTSPLIPYINALMVGLLLYAGIVGIVLTVVPEHTRFHSFVQRVFLPSALSISALFAVMIIIVGVAFGWATAALIFR